MNIYVVAVLLCLSLALPSLGCTTVKVTKTSDSEATTRDQGLSGKDKSSAGQDCEARCMEQFHQCKDERKKGPGASECAHAKNDCKSTC